MQNELAGKTALITGSSSGIGFAIAKLLGDKGCKVALNGRDEKKLNIANQQIKNSVIVVGDVSKPIEAKKIVTDAVEKLGKLDILVCNVGSGRSCPPGQETSDEWQRMFDLNFFSTTATVLAAQNTLIESKGCIICISSICGVETIEGAPVTYSAAKAALNSFVKGISRPFGEKGVRINAIAPGNILFEGSSWEAKLNTNKDVVTNMLKKNVPLGRFGSPNEIAELVAFLASSRASFATGGIWTLDGGQTHS